MADDTSKRGRGDRSQVAAEQPYEIDYFARKHGISRNDAQLLIDRIGNDRAKLDVAASKLSAPKSVAPTRGKNTERKTVAKGASSTRKRASAASPRILSAKRAMMGPTAKLVGAAAVGLVAGLAANLGRKTAAQAPSALAGDWFEAVKVEHKLALALFDQIEATDDSQSGERSVLLAQLKHALGKHAFTEENVLYPALRDWGDKADADKLNHDHGYVKQSLFELEEIDTATPSFLVRIAAFRADLEAHIREEEEAVFPPLHAALSDERNTELTRMANKEGFKLA